MKRQLIVWGIIILYFLSSTSHSMVIFADETYSINYNSYIDLEYDLTPLNRPLEINKIYSIPITVKYWTNIPDIFKTLQSRFTYRFLFGSTIDPKIEISLVVNNTPSWADIYLTSSDLLVDIPYMSDGKTTVETVLIITPSSDAPHISYKIDIIASSDQMKRLNGFTYKESIEFTPDYIPSIEVIVENLTIVVDRKNKTIIPIEVINKGNHKSQISASLLYDTSSYFDIFINPISMNLSIEETGDFNLSVNLNTDFDFFENVDFSESIELKFKCEKYPPDNNNSIQDSTYFVFAYRQNDFDDFVNSYLAIILIIFFIIFISIILVIIRRRLKK